MSTTHLKKAEQVAETLNTLLRIDAQAIEKLIGEHVDCNAALFKHTVGFDVPPLPQGYSCCTIGTLDIINALISPYIIAVAYDDCQLSEFVVMDSRQYTECKNGGAI